MRQMRRMRRWGGPVVGGAIVAAACGDVPTTVSPEPEPPHCTASTTAALEPGEAALLPAGDSVCFDVAAAGRYALAFFDSAGVEREVLDRSPFHPSDSFSVTVRSFAPPATAAALVLVEAAPMGLASSGMAQVPSPRAASPRHHLVTSSSADCAPPTSDVWCRTTPWVEGDRFQFDAEGGRTAEIVAVIDGMALAFWADEVESMTPRLPFFRAVATHSVASVVPFLRAKVADIAMETGPGTGQIVVLARDEDLSLAHSRAIEGGSLGMIQFGLRDGADDEVRRTVHVRTMAHELGHLWQFHHLLGLEGGDDVLTHQWAVEGGADLVAREYLRDRFELPLEPEREDWPGGLLNTPEDAYWNELHRSRGELERGYFYAEPFLRDLLVRQMRAGVPHAEALQTLVHGSMEGWRGHPGRTFGGEGLTSRLARTLGDVDPVGMVITWTLSNALDDRSPSEVFRNRTADRAWREVGLAGWPPVATLTPGRKATASARVGSTGYFVIQSPGGPTRPVLVTHSTGEYGPELGPQGPVRARTGVRWMIARID